MSYWTVKKPLLDSLLLTLDIEDVELHLAELQEVTGFTGERAWGDSYDALGVLVDLSDVYHGDRIDAIIEAVNRILIDKCIRT
jgi:hypothetical protein